MDHSPTVRGRRLMRELKRLREQAGITPDEASARLDFSKSKLYRLENGRSRVDADDLEDMLDLYDVRSPDRDALIRLGRESRRRGWWTRYKDVFTGSYVALESEAAAIRINAHLVPGFLQTPAYAREVIQANGPWLDTPDTERRVAARTARRDSLFEREDPPKIHIILDESGLHRQVAGPKAHADQLRALAEAAERPNLTLQVLPFAHGAAPGMDGHFVILTFPDPEDPPVAYAEGLFGDLLFRIKGGSDPFRGGLDSASEEGAGPRRIDGPDPRGSQGDVVTPRDDRPTPADLLWRKSTYSNVGNECVEVAQSGPTLLIRDSMSPAVQPFRMSRIAWCQLTNNLKSHDPRNRSGSEESEGGILERADYEAPVQEAIELFATGLG